MAKARSSDWQTKMHDAEHLIEEVMEGKSPSEVLDEVDFRGMINQQAMALHKQSKDVSAYVKRMTTAFVSHELLTQGFSDAEVKAAVNTSWLYPSKYKGEKGYVPGASWFGGGPTASKFVKELAKKPSGPNPAVGDRIARKVAAGVLSPKDSKKFKIGM